MNKFKLKKNIIEKYNVLYFEVAKYYGLEQYIETLESNSLYYVPAYKLGTNSVNAIQICEHYEKKYPYLVPFYKIFNYHIFLNTTVEFKEINRVIKKIRKEK